MRFFGKPTTKDVLNIRDFRDSGFNYAMRHADELLHFESKSEKAYALSLKNHKQNQRVVKYG